MVELAPPKLESLKLFLMKVELLLLMLVVVLTKEWPRRARPRPRARSSVVSSSRVNSRLYHYDTIKIYRNSHLTTPVTDVQAI